MRARLSFHCLWVAASVMIPVAARATVLHAYVSNTGLDKNGCTRLAPCATLAAAYNATTPGGVITVLNVGDYGPVTIGHSLTIDGMTGQNGSIVLGAGTAISITAGSSSVVELRHLALNGGGTATAGVNVSTGTGQVVIEDCTINGFSGYGIESSANQLVVKDTTLTSNWVDIWVQTGVGTLRNVDIHGGWKGVLSCSVSNISKSVIADTTDIGVEAQMGSLSVEDCMLSNNNTAAISDSGSVLRLSNDDIFDNSVGLGNGGGTIASAVNNKDGGNTSNTGSVNAPLTVF